MTKAKTIDRLALTRAKFGVKMYGDKPQSVGEQIIDGLKEAIEITRAANQHKQGYSTCPNCGQVALIHSDGCNHCLSCGWSACS